MGDRLDQLLLRHTVLDRATEVEPQLLAVPAGDECRDRDEAPVAGAQLRPVPDVLEEDVVGEGGELRGDVADGPAASADPLLLFERVRIAEMVRGGRAP